MARQAYINWAPRGASQILVGLANEICREYQRQGYDLTLRQLYYQFVARGHIANNQRSYKNLGGVIDKARLAGLLDWSYIVDRTRNAYRTDGADTSPEDAIQGTAEYYRRALWENQPWHVEVWVEKEALAGVVQRAAQQMGVTYFSCRGYVSQSEMHSAAGRLRYWRSKGKQTLLVHLGDHDPSGIDMSRDIQDRLALFGALPTFDRIALNMDQVQQYDPPPNPAKVTDSRFEQYLQEYGEESWELDALDPAVLNELIVERVQEIRDEYLWREAEQQQERERESLTAVSDNWPDVVNYMEQEGWL